MEKEIDDDEIERKAIEEILLETKRASERAKEFGSSGWIKPKIPSTNKNFLRNTLVSTLRHPYSINKHGSFSKLKDESHSSASDVKKPHDLMEQCTSKSESKLSGQQSPNLGTGDHKNQRNSRKRQRSSSPVKYLYDAYDYEYESSNVQVKAEQDLPHSKRHRHDGSYKKSKTKGSRRTNSSESNESHNKGKRKKKSSKKHKSNHHKKTKNK